MASEDKIILPEKYYLDNFKYVLEFVLSKYEPLLSDQEIEFISDFMNFSEDAQCLYVRLSNRKGQFFRKEKLNYPEIPNISKAAKKLMTNGYLEQRTSVEIEECYQLINIYTKGEILNFLIPYDLSIDKKLKKEELILFLLENQFAEDLFETFYSDDILTQGKLDQLDMIKLFFFGHNHGDMSDFVIRDVGHAKFMEIDESKLGTSFDSREEAEAVMQLSQLNKEFYLLEEAVSPLSIYEWFKEIEIRYFLDLEKARTRAEKLIHKVGYHLEKNKHHEEALELYHYSSASPLRERRIRIYNKQKDFEKSLTLANQILENPNDNKEYYIALDVINKLDKKLKTTTLRQKEGITIPVDSSFVHQVEQGALNYFESRGFNGYHSENSISRNLFGLFFWDEIFDPQYNSLHQPLQRNPSDIYGKDFFEKRKDVITEKLKSIQSKNQLEKILRKSISLHADITNPFVYWSDEMLRAMWVFIDFVKLKALKNLLLDMSLDPKNRSTGFPDLFVWKENEYAFYEIKSPNDHLSEKQLYWLERFSEWGIHAEIALVEWV